MYSLENSLWTCKTDYVVAVIIIIIIIIIITMIYCL